MSHPTVLRIAHCDWGASNSKRAMCIANKHNDVWSIDTLCEAGETKTLLHRIRDGLDQSQRVVIGFDFPIGYPKAFGEKAGLGLFVDAISSFGKGKWEHFFIKTDDAELVSIHRPFYPRTGKPKGSTTQEQHSHSLDIQWSDLFRRCELETSNRKQASPLFWTLGAKAVGTAAICGWQEILQPLLADKKRSFQIWPFEGNLYSILQQGYDVVVETYPGEAYSHIGFPEFWSGKTNQEKRRKRAQDMLGWAERNRVSISQHIRYIIEDGFGANAQGEDPFDAVIGLCSMIAVIEEDRPEGPEGFRTIDGIANHEGWIFGQQNMPVAGNKPDNDQSGKLKSSLSDEGHELSSQGGLDSCSLRSSQVVKTPRVSNQSGLPIESIDHEKQRQIDEDPNMRNKQDEQIQMMQFIMDLGESTHPDGNYAYGEIAKMNKPFLPPGARGVGARLGAICRNHLGVDRLNHERCCFRVVDGETRRHSCQQFSSSQ